MAATATLTDNFNDNSMDAALWGDFGSSNVTETNQRLEITTTAAANYFTFYSLTTYDMTGSYVLAQAISIGNQALTTRQTIMFAEIDSNNKVYFQAEQNLLYAVKTVGGVFSFPASVAYGAGTTWWRIREASGTTYWDYSGDGISWTNLHSESNPITLTAVTIGLQAGNYAAEASGSTSSWDNFNLPPSASPKRYSLSLTGVG